jgi:hypothetical protein
MKVLDFCWGTFLIAFGGFISAFPEDKLVTGKRFTEVSEFVLFPWLAEKKISLLEITKIKLLK